MESFKQYLNEASLSRVYDHSKNRNIGIISANRGENTKKENDALSNTLKSDIRSGGYGFIKINGKYIENKGTDKEAYVDETSYMIIGTDTDDKGKLKNFIKKLGEKYKQDCIFYKAFDSDQALLIGTKSGAWPGHGVEEPKGTFHPNKVSDYMSYIDGKGKSFTFE